MRIALHILLLVIGLVVLAKAADAFVLAAARLALTLRISPLVVGAVVIGFGTGAPELLVSSLAAARGSLDIAVGNVVGSNLANLTLVLGVAGLIARPEILTDAGLTVVAASSMAGVAALAWLFLGLAGRLRRWEAAVLLTIYGMTMPLIA